MFWCSCAENAIPCLFKKYMQASADHARKYGGTGLGLAICKQLVKLFLKFYNIKEEIKELRSSNLSLFVYRLS